MDKKNWILIQFNRFDKATSKYRCAILLTSFLETAVRDMGRDNSDKRVSFFRSLKNLGMVESPFDNNKLELEKSKADPNSLRKIEIVRQCRNKLLHEILNKEMAEAYIEGLIDETIKQLKSVYQESELVRNYFRERYGFDPKDELK